MPTAGVHCKENKEVRDPKTNEINIIPSNQHFGTNSDSGSAWRNTIYATYGSEDINGLLVKKKEATTAYVMSTPTRDGKIVLRDTGDETYDLGIARFEVKNEEYIRLKLQQISLPQP